MRHGHQTERLNNAWPSPNSKPMFFSGSIQVQGPGETKYKSLARAEARRKSYSGSTNQTENYSRALRRVATSALSIGQNWEKENDGSKKSKTQKYFHLLYLRGIYKT